MERGPKDRVTREERCSFPVGTDRPARRRPAALDRPVTPVPCYGPASRRNSAFHWNTFVYQLYAVVTYSHERSLLSSLFIFVKAEVLCDLQYLPAHACTARGAPPSPRCTRGTTLPSSRWRGGAARFARCHRWPSSHPCWYPALQVLRTCSCLSLQPARPRAGPAESLLSCGCCRIHMASGIIPADQTRRGLIPVATRQQPQLQVRLLPRPLLPVTAR